MIDNAPLVIGARRLLCGVLHMYAWTALEEFNWFDIVMREGRPFEDLSARGQLLVVASWICTASAVGLIMAVHLLHTRRDIVFAGRR